MVISSSARFPKHPDALNQKLINTIIKVPFYNCFSLIFVSFLLPLTATQIFHATGIQIGWIIASQLIGSVVMNISLMMVPRNWQKKNMIIAGSWGKAISLLSLFIAIVTQSFFLLILSQVFSGCFVTLIRTPTDLLLTKNSSVATRTRIFGRRMKYNGYGCLLGTGIAFSMYTLFQLTVDSNILIFSPLVLFCFISFWAGLEFCFQFNGLQSRNSSQNLELADFGESNDTEINEKKKGTTSRYKLGFGVLAVTFIFLGLNQTISKSFIQMLILNQITTNESIIFLIYIPSQIISLILAPYLADLSVKISPYLLISVLCIFGCVFTLLLLQITSSIIFTLILTTDAAIAYAGSIILKNYISKAPETEKLGKLFSLINLASIIGMISGPIIGGWLWDTQDIQTPFIYSVIIEGILILPYLFAIKLINLQSPGVK
ncbi:MFS transporter [Candidatus Lokiarchaeum ossiferum]|uniref:MFS transporter n=1 Tax=Candidatus Lokiarchaeum ossiferum TaxID=2951803 RepID=UPI00352DD47B